MSAVFRRGEQIAYVPLHADGNLNHPDVEFGFVVGPAGENAYFCQYWRKGELGILRTVANSESTPADMLVSVWSVPQATVDTAIAKIEAEPAEDDEEPEWDTAGLPENQGLAGMI